MLQADMCSHSAPPDGYIEPVYDDHAVLERWRSHHEMHTCPDESDPNMMIAPLAAEKLAHRALDSATEGMIADVIQVWCLPQLSNLSRATTHMLTMTCC